jgi:hypothetical protein
VGGSGIAQYDVYVSVDSGPFTLWQDDTTASSATYSGSFGRTYSFYSVAADNVGHVELPPELADASTHLQQFSTTVVTIASDFTVSRPVQESELGNPKIYDFRESGLVKLPR